MLNSHKTYQKCQAAPLTTTDHPVRSLWFSSSFFCATFAASHLPNIESLMQHLRLRELPTSKRLLTTCKFLNMFSLAHNANIMVSQQWEKWSWSMSIAVIPHWLNRVYVLSVGRLVCCIDYRVVYVVYHKFSFCLHLPPRFSAHSVVKPASSAGYMAGCSIDLLIQKRRRRCACCKH